MDGKTADPGENSLIKMSSPMTTSQLFKYMTPREMRVVKLAATLSFLHGLLTPLAVLVLGVALSKFTKPGSFSGSDTIVTVMGKIALQFIALAVVSAVTAYGARLSWVWAAEMQAMVRYTLLLY
jgi:uncharacterized membrane protein YidH (DUF202 family)